jgi:hypothetical protein
VSAAGEWRRGLTRLSNALIVYGVVGILAAAIGFAALISASGRIGSLGDRIVSEAVSLDSIIVLTADALDDAATTADTFGPTIAQTSATVTAAASAVREIEPRLRDLETQANAIDIFGQRPVARLGELFAAFPDNRFALTEIVVGPQGVFEVATLTGTNEGPWAGAPPSGLPVSLQVLILFPWDPATERFAGERIWFDRGGRAGRGGVTG